MSSSRPNGLANPPGWIEALLREVLHPRDRDPVSGDLLEEYREEIAPAVGEWRAGFWYFRQILSLLSFSGLYRLASRLARANGVIASVLWIVAGGLVVLAILLLMASNHFGPPRVPLPLVSTVALALGAIGVTAVRSSSDAGLMGRAGLFWGGMFACVLTVRMVFDALIPFSPEDGFSRGQGVDRGMILGIGIATVYLAAGFWGAWSTGRFRAGIVTALSASAIGWLGTFAVTNLVVTRFVGTFSDGTPARVFIAQNGAILPIALFLLLLSSILGGIGALFGRGMNGIRRRRNEGAD